MRVEIEATVDHVKLLRPPGRGWATWSIAPFIFIAFALKLDAGPGDWGAQIFKYLFATVLAVIFLARYFGTEELLIDQRQIAISRLVFGLLHKLQFATREVEYVQYDPGGDGSSGLQVKIEGRLRLIGLFTGITEKDASDCLSAIDRFGIIPTCPR